MIRITKQVIEDIKVAYTLKHCQIKINFEIRVKNNKYVNFPVYIHFDEKYNERYTKRYFSSIITDREQIINTNDIGEFDSFYSVVDERIFDVLDKFLADYIKDDLIGDICSEITKRIQKVIKDEKIIIG